MKIPTIHFTIGLLGNELFSMTLYAAPVHDCEDELMGEWTDEVEMHVDEAVEVWTEDEEDY